MIFGLFKKYDGSHGVIYSVKLPNNRYFKSVDRHGNILSTSLGFLRLGVKKMSFKRAEYCARKYSGEIVVL